jgi:hypothetical protein
MTGRPVDDLTIVLEALRRAQAKIAFYREPGNGNVQRAFDELVDILDDEAAVRAVQRLQASSPSTVPEEGAASAEHALHRALPGS